jgi:hypothetical protein
VVARPCSTRADVLVVVEGVVRVVLGLDLGESPVGVPVDVGAVGLSNAADVVVGIKEIDVDAGAVGLEGVEAANGVGAIGDDGDDVVGEAGEVRGLPVVVPPVGDGVVEGGPGRRRTARV